MGANMAKVVKIPKVQMDDQKSKLMNGFFSMENKPIQRTTMKKKQHVITQAIPAASPPKPDLPSPTLPTIDNVTFSEDEEQVSDLPKAPTPKKSKKASAKDSKAEKYKEG